MTPELNPVQREVLTALRGATVLTRVPGVTTPDGHEHWFTLGQLVLEGRIGRNSMYASAAKALRRLKLVDGRTHHTVTYYSVNPAGLLALAAWETEQDWSAVAAAQLDVEQARYDVEQATARSTAAERALEAAYAARTQRAVAS